MKQVAIENPIINSPFEVPKRHFRFDDEGITDEIVQSRRGSSYFIPIAKPRKKGKQLQFETEWTQDRVEENRFINEVRTKVDLWRQVRDHTASGEFIEISDPWDARNTIRASLATERSR